MTPQGDDDQRPQSDPAAFVRSKGTLYILSKEGKGTAGPLVTALTVGRGSGRSRQRLPLARATKPLQPLRLPGHRPDDHPSVLVPRR